MLRMLLVFAFLVVLRADSAHHEAESSPWTRGIIKKLDLEGGFFGILTEGEEKLLPVDLPEKLRQNGLAVRFRYRELKNVVSLQMWGTSVVITEIEEITGSNEASPQKP